MNRKQIEEKFMEWVKERDDDWWEDGQGHFSIWDVRVMIDFIQHILNLKEIERQKNIDEFNKKLNV